MQNKRLRSVKRSVKNPHAAMELAVLPLLLSLASCASCVTVSTNEGALQGRTTRVLDKEIQVFLGIPYAKPPVGNLRFKKPQAAEPWQGVYDARQARESCAQPPYPGIFDIPTALSEDCLYLNVWTPLASTSQGSPVLVWFHGGMFQVGSAYEARYNGSALAALNEVVVVSCNFRLSLLGFLDLNHTTIPGNLALWDQRAALQWVQRNIRAFGGDPGSVTVFGESSGAMSIHGHILSPHSSGLFHRVFLMSGSMSNDVCMYTVSETIAGVNIISEAVGCGSYEGATDPGELLDCLRGRPAQDLCAAQSEVLRPTYENEFIPCRPSFSMKERYFENYDAMVSVTANEGAFVFHFHPDKGVLNDDLSSYELTNLKDSLKILLRLFVRNRHASAAMNYIDNLHFENNDELRNTIADILGNRLFYCPSRVFAEEYSAKGNNVYAMVFGHRSEKTRLPKWFGATHLEEVQFVFGIPFLNLANYTDKDREFSAHAMAILASFARSGKPTLPDGEELPKFTTEHPDFTWLQAGNYTVAQGFAAAACDMWKQPP
ncbi:acetylcholinesterase-like [Rhipicephalus sanguineus]|uniref:acetylcholinesterase-like n=1 Tax=Rhipicephalus sanguineus TaxID=34632 RepID=UPI00189412D1|nr:acetylcholinesterase-like [Rhipicephalus sanguineus]